MRAVSTTIYTLIKSRGMNTFTDHKSQTQFVRPSSLCRESCPTHNLRAPKTSLNCFALRQHQRRNRGCRRTCTICEKQTTWRENVVQMQFAQRVFKSNRNAGFPFETARHVTTTWRSRHNQAQPDHSSNQGSGTDWGTERQTICRLIKPAEPSLTNLTPSLPHALWNEVLCAASETWNIDLRSTNRTHYI